MKLPARQDPARVAELEAEVKRLSCDLAQLSGTLRGIGAILASSPAVAVPRRDVAYDVAEMRSTLRGIGAVLSVSPCAGDADEVG